VDADRFAPHAGGFAFAAGLCRAGERGRFRRCSGQRLVSGPLDEFHDGLHEGHPLKAAFPVACLPDG
jgi:hypothetical protein